MATEKIWIVNEQDMVRVSEVRAMEPVERNYYVQHAPVTPAQVEVQPRMTYIQPGYYMPRPVAPVVIYQSSHDSGLIVASFLALLILLIVGFSAVLILAWVAAGHLPWLGY